MSSVAPGLACRALKVTLMNVKKAEIGGDANLAEDKSFNLIMQGPRLNGCSIWWIKPKNTGLEYPLLSYLLLYIKISFPDV